MSQLIEVDPDALLRYDRPVPRYTSYPTAPQFVPLDNHVYREALSRFNAHDKPLSLYVHIPFCQKMCLFCGCSVVLNRKGQTQRRYLDHLISEMELLGLAKKRAVQLHLGGGTPTSLSVDELAEFMDICKKHFCLDGEVAIEIDPRTVFQDGGEKLRKIYELGWNRVSFGVQDLDPQVQEAVHRRQTEEMTVKTYTWAREIGFTGINLDLIYGLPYQTVQTFTKTIEKIIELRPDRLSLFSYAKVPWLKPHQKAIDDALLPSTVEKFTIYTEARRRLMEAGYVAIGMDHFALPEDAMAEALQAKKLQRNFQGYSLDLAKDMIGLGMSSIGFLENIYFQNHKTIAEYEESIEQGVLPISKGYVLHADDLLRAWVIQQVMCLFIVDKRDFAKKFGILFDLYFSKQKEQLDQLEREGLIENRQEVLKVTPMGEVLVRLIASVFDAYLGKGNYSKAV